MKKIFKTLLLALSISVALCALTVTGYAQEEDSPAFSVYDKNGTLTEICGNTYEELQQAASSVADGDTIVLNSNIEITSRIEFASTEESPRKINFDLNGRILFATSKFDVGSISVGSYTTLNVYSSREGGTIYLCNLSNQALNGNVFNLKGKYATLNVGDFNARDKFYPGSNLSTYSACLVDVIADATMPQFCCELDCVLNINGGSYYSICSDYSGFIIPRGGDVVMNINDANIISMETKTPINSYGVNTVLNLNRCVIVQYRSDTIKLFNNALGTVNMTDCTTSYVFDGAAGGLGQGTVNLIGKNVFSAESIGDYQTSMIKNPEGLVCVTTYSTFELNGGLKQLEYYDGTLSFRAHTCEVPTLKNPTTLIPAEEELKYQFVKGKNKITQSWMASEEPEYPFTLSNEGVPGVYKTGWQKTIDESGMIICTAGYVADYNLKIRAVYENDELYFKLYVPSEIVDGGYIDFVNVKIQGEAYSKTEWYDETVDGVKYYYATTGVIETEGADEVITVRVPCDYGKGVYVDTTWSFTLKNYVNEILKTETENVYSEEQYTEIHKIYSIYLSKEEN